MLAANPFISNWLLDNSVGHSIWVIQRDILGLGYNHSLYYQNLDLREITWGKHLWERGTINIISEDVEILMA